MAGSLLTEFLRSERAGLLERWQQRVAEVLDTTDMSRIELLDHMPDFLDEILAALDADVQDAARTSWSPEQSAPAHGSQRLRSGFDVDEVVREYGILTDVILQAVTKAGVPAGPAELRVLLHAINAGAAEAVRTYTQRRDDELKRQEAKHRSFIAHELRTPIGSALAALRVLGRTMPELDASPVTALLRRSVQGLSELIDQVLIGGALAAGAEPNVSDVDVVAIVRDVERSLADEAEGRGVRLAVVDAPDALPARADGRLLRSAIVNLVRNAVKFSCADSGVFVQPRREKDEIVVEVRDGCGGLPPEGWTTMFEPFTQAGPNRAGLGLGLAIAKQATEMHGGRIDVRNSAPLGCVFELRIPANGPTPESQ